jgi:hypothetical protein
MAPRIGGDAIRLDHDHAARRGRPEASRWGARRARWPATTRRYILTPPFAQEWLRLRSGGRIALDLADSLTRPGDVPLDGGGVHSMPLSRTGVVGTRGHC